MIARRDAIRLKNYQEATLKVNTDRTLRILCVDDEEDFRELISNLMKSLRIEAKAVASAAQALQLIRLERFDLYLLDAWLPRVDGFELCRKLRITDQQTPIFFFTGAAFVADRKRGMEAGANAYVVKPDIDSLVENIKTWFAPGGVVAVPPLYTTIEKTSVLLT
jgi:DNA-binding response OmpR family regulator